MQKHTHMYTHKYTQRHTDTHAILYSIPHEYSLCTDAWIELLHILEHFGYIRLIIAL